MTDSRAITLWPAVLIFGVVLLAFFPALGNDFVDWDDYAFVAKNPWIISLSFRSLAWTLTTFYQGAWHPLTWLSHALDLSVGGTNPAYHHLVSVIIHSLNAVLFFLLCLKLQQGLGIQLQRQYLTAFTAALLFGVHPLRVESVVWISERKDVLCSFFSLASLMAYLSFAREEGVAGRRRAYALSFGLCVLALLSKAMAITLPLVMIILDFYPLNRVTVSSFKSRILEKIPFFAAALGAGLLNFMAAKDAVVPLAHAPLELRAMNALYGIIFYLQKSLLPSNLNPLHQFDTDADFFALKYLVPGLLVVVATVVCVLRAIKGDRIWASAWSYYVVTLAPALGLFMPYRHAVADRYSYLPTLALWLLVGLGVGRLWEASRGQRIAVPARALLLVGLGALAVLYGYETRRWIAVWKNSETLWSQVIVSSDPAPAFAHFGKGMALESRGELDLALDYYRKALTMEPHNSRYLGRIAHVAARKGDLPQALAIYRKIQWEEPASPKAHLDVGRILALMGRLDESVKEIEKAISADPNEARAWGLLASVHLKRNDKIKALQCYNRYLSLGYPRSSDIDLALGLTPHSTQTPQRKAPLLGE